MLQAYIDDSGRGQSSGDFVMAGFVAPVENWLDFNHAWQTVLDAPRTLDYLHTRKGMHPVPSGPFKGWTREECDAKIYQLIGVIHSFGFLSVRISIPHKHYGTAFKGTFPTKRGKRLDNPFYLPVYSTIMVTLRALAQNGIVDKVNFTFDNETAQEQKLILDAWHGYKDALDLSIPTFPEYRIIRQMVGDPPDFRSDKDVLPLQAADLFAWHVRKNSEYRERGEDYTHLAWQSLSAIEGPHRDWKSGDLTGVALEAIEITDAIKTKAVKSRSGRLCQSSHKSQL